MFINKYISKLSIHNICLIIIICILIFIIIYFLYRLIANTTENFKNENSNSNTNTNSNTNIIIPDIIGGLGNQLFVVASAYAYSKQNNSYNLVLDNRKEVGSYGKPRPTYNDTVFYKIKLMDIDTSQFTKLNEPDFSNIIVEDSNPPDNNIKSNIFLTGGYYQEAKYFNKYRNELLDILEPNTNTLQKVNDIFTEHNIDINKDFLVAIHIRLDDVYTPIDADKRVYDKDEYDIIIQKLPEHVNNNPNTKFIIFSNDVPKTKEIFKSSEIDKSRMIYIQSEDYVELALMAKCNDYIASPSTFNWWGIYLNPNPNKKVFIYWKQDSDYRKDFYKKYEYLRDNGIINSLVLNENTIENFYNNNYNNNNDNNANNNNSNSNKNNTNNIINNFTCVSGYWNVNNKHGNKFNNWFTNTLSVNCPYVFFTTEDNIDNIKTFRKNYPTHFIKKNVTDFKTYKLNMSNKTDNIHVPSKELGLIWLEKMNLLLEASIINPYKSEWFCWIDAGICIYRDKKPSTNIFPNPGKMHLLSKTQINYCTSDNITNDELNKIKTWEYVHNISGTSFIIHISMIQTIYNLFYKSLDKCINDINGFICYSDQCIWSYIYVYYPDLFNKIGDGYGKIIEELT